MSLLIEEFKYSHFEISNIFMQVVKLGIMSEESRKKLFHIKATLLAHLKKEDEELYPILWKEAENNQDLKLKLESFAREMDSVTSTITAFFKKYFDGEFEDDFKNDLKNNFKNDFKKMFIILTKRINREESELFPEYIKLNLD